MTLKTLLFNGCSYMAGDELVWEEYCLETTGKIIPWATIGQDCSNQIFEDHYRFDYRRRRNLPATVAKGLSLDHIDLSEDGNSNDNIALTTILYLSNKSPQERKQYHVCIGWSSIDRLLRYNPQFESFYNYNIHHAVDPSPIVGKLSGYLHHAIACAADHDFSRNYYSAIALLENFLILNQITYTFYRALGGREGLVHDLGAFPVGDLSVNVQINHSTFTDASKWYSNWDVVSDMTYPPHLDHSWTSELELNYANNFVSETNFHPNVRAVAKLSKSLIKFIQETVLAIQED